jgi:uncharacterized protein (UPF0335 family)
MKTFKQLREGLVEGKGYNIDQDDHDTFTPDEIKQIKNSHFPDNARSNLIFKKKTDKKHLHHSDNSGGETNLGSPVGSASNNTYESVAEANKHSIIGRIQRGNELKKKVDSSFKDIGDAQKAGDSAAGSKAFRKHERYANLERPGTWTKPVNEDGMGAGAVASGPTNVTSSGAIAGMGEPPGSKSGEPGVDLRKKKRTTSDPRMFKQFRRKSPQA